MVANKMLEKKAKVYVEEKKNRLLNIFQSASGNVRFGGETRSLEKITAAKYERCLEAAQDIFDDDNLDFKKSLKSLNISPILRKASSLSYAKFERKKRGWTSVNVVKFTIFSECTRCWKHKPE